MGQAWYQSQFASFKIGKGLLCLCSYILDTIQFEFRIIFQWDGSHEETQTPEIPILSSKFLHVGKVHPPRHL